MAMPNLISGRENVFFSKARTAKCFTFHSFWQENCTFHSLIRVVLALADKNTTLCLKGKKQEQNY